MATTAQFEELWARRLQESLDRLSTRFGSIDITASWRGELASDSRPDGSSRGGSRAGGFLPCGGGNGRYIGEHACGFHPDEGIHDGTDALTGGYRPNEGDRGDAGPSYGGNGDPDCGVGSSYGISGGRGFYSCSKEVANPPVLSEGSALRVFDGMPPSAVVWNEDIWTDCNSYGGLLDHLRDLEDYLVTDEREAMAEPFTENTLIQAAGPTKVASMDPVLVMDPIQLEGPAGEVFDKMPAEDVVWDVEFGNNLDSQCGLLQQLAMGTEYLVVEDSKPIAEIFNGDSLTNVSGALLFDLDVDSVPEHATAFERTKAVSDEQAVLMDLSVSESAASGVFSESPCENALCVEVKSMPQIKLNTDEVFTHEFKSFPYLEHDGDDADQMSDGASDRSIIGANEMFNETYWNILDKEVRKVILHSQAQAYEYSCTKTKLAQYNDNAMFIGLSPTVDVTAQIPYRISSWQLDGFGPWSKLTDKALRLVFLAYAYLMDREYRRLYIIFKQWDSGILRYTAASTHEISSSALFVQSSVTLLVSLLQVLNPAYLSTQLVFWALSIFVSIWLRLRAFLVAFELKMMALKQFSRDGKHISVRSVRRQACLGADWEIVNDYKLLLLCATTKEGKGECQLVLYMAVVRQWGPGIQVGSLRQWLVLDNFSAHRFSLMPAHSSYDRLLHLSDAMEFVRHFLIIRWLWDPGIDSSNHETSHDNLAANISESKQSTVIEHRGVLLISVAWGQATFWGAGSVTPGDYVNGPVG